MMAICLLRLNYVIQGETIRLNSPKLSMIAPGCSQGSLSRCLRLKQEQSCFCFSKCWEYCENFPKCSSHLSAPLYMDTSGKTLSTALFLAQLISTVCFPPLILLHFLSLELFSSFQTCVCLSATHIQMTNSSACERAPLLWTHDTSLPHTFIANQCRWHHFLTQCHWRSMGIMPCFLTVTGNQWGWRHHLRLLILTLVINNKTGSGRRMIMTLAVRDDR